MKNKILSSILLVISLLFLGCSKSNDPIMTSTLKATDYTKSCEMLLTEIKKYETQYKEEKNGGVIKTVTFGVIGTDEELEVMLRERIKNLELIYAMKKLQGECKEEPEQNRVTVNFTEKDSKE